MSAKERSGDKLAVARGFSLGSSHEQAMAPLMKRLHVEPLAELGWPERGVHLSRSSLDHADRRAIAQSAGPGSRPPELADCSRHGD